MLTIETQEDGGRTLRVNQSKLRKNPDKWLDYTLPEEPDPIDVDAPPIVERVYVWTQYGIEWLKTIEKYDYFGQPEVGGRVSELTLQHNGYQIRKFVQNGVMEIKTIVPAAPTTPSPSPPPPTRPSLRRSALSN